MLDEYFSNIYFLLTNENKTLSLNCQQTVWIPTGDGVKSSPKAFSTEAKDGGGVAAVEALEPESPA